MPDGAIEIKRAQIGDLEMGSMIPPGLNVRGALLGNPMWRSPESHAAARINLPSDIFSYSLVVSSPSIPPWETGYLNNDFVLSNQVHLYNASEDHFPD